MARAILVFLVAGVCVALGARSAADGHAYVAVALLVSAINIWACTGMVMNRSSSGALPRHLNVLFPLRSCGVKPNFFRMPAYFLGLPLLLITVPVVLLSIPIVGQLVVGMIFKVLPCTGGHGGPPVCMFLGHDVGGDLYNLSMGIFLGGALNFLYAGKLLFTYIHPLLYFIWVQAVLFLMVAWQASLPSKTSRG